MAGLGGKNWTFQEEVTSSDVNGYLADQVVMRFADSATRTAGFGGSGEPTLAEGMVSYLDDANRLDVYNGSAWIPVFPQEIAIFCEEQAQNTAGGTLTANTWTKRTLNTTKTNSITGCSIASSVITLATAGTYWVFALAPLFGAVNSHQLRLRNTTDSTNALLGGSSYVGFSNGSNHAPLMGVVTITASKNFELQHIGSTPNSGSLSLGVAGNFTTEVYAQIYIARIA